MYGPSRSGLLTAFIVARGVWARDRNKRKYRFSYCSIHCRRLPLLFQVRQLAPSSIGNFVIRRSWPQAEQARPRCAKRARPFYSEDMVIF